MAVNGQVMVDVASKRGRVVMVMGGGRRWAGGGQKPKLAGRTINNK